MIDFFQNVKRIILYYQLTKLCRNVLTVLITCRLDFPLQWNNKLRLIADWNEMSSYPWPHHRVPLAQASVFPSPSRGVDCSPSARWACPVIGAVGGDLFPSFPSVAAVCRWAARRAMPSCHLSDRVQFPGHLFPSITEGEEENGEWWRL